MLAAGFGVADLPRGLLVIIVDENELGGGCLFSLGGLSSGIVVVGPEAERSKDEA